MACIHIRIKNHVSSWQTLDMNISCMFVGNDWIGPRAIKHIHYPRIPLPSRFCIRLKAYSVGRPTLQHDNMAAWILKRSARIFECMWLHSLAKPCVYPTSTCSDRFVHNYSDDLRVLSFLVVFLSAPRSQLRQVASLLLVLSLKS